MVGSLGKLYESFENLNDIYMQPNLKRDILLKPKESADVPNNLGLLTNLESPKTRIYYCSRRHDVPYVSHDHNATCPNCYNKLGYQASYVPTLSTPITKTDGFVKGVVTYIVTDELEVKPNLTIASILQLERFNVKCICDLEEKDVEVSMDEFYVCVYGLNPKDIPRSTGYSNKRPRKHYVADRSGTVCPECNYAMYTPATCVASPANAKKKRPAVPEGGYVKDVVTYMIMDDLEVKPMSTNSSIAVLNKFMSRMLVPLKRK
ncbi:hypothetical protein ACLB2K_071645 [Fragaria x ananassa]